MSRRKLMALPLAVGALALLAGCSDTPMAPNGPQLSEPTAMMAPAAFPDTTDFRNMSGQLWVCATGNQAGSDFHYRYTVKNRATGAVVASGMAHGVNIGQCVLLASVPTNVRGHYLATVKQDAPGIFYFAHGFFNFGDGYPVTPPPSSVNLLGRTMTSGLSSDGGVVMTFHNLLRQPN